MSTSSKLGRCRFLGTLFLCASRGGTGIVKMRVDEPDLVPVFAFTFEIREVSRWFVGIGGGYALFRVLGTNEEGGEQGVSKGGCELDLGRLVCDGPGSVNSQKSITVGRNYQPCADNGDGLNSRSSSSSSDKSLSKTSEESELATALQR